MKVHAAIARALHDSDVRTLFGVLGDANIFLVDSFIRDLGETTYVAAANEAGAVLMAGGFASASGEVGVATVTHGPGLTNTITALVECVRAELPVLLLTGDTPSDDLYNLQSIWQRELVLATGAGFEQVRSARTAIEDLTRARRRADLERRPVVLNIPAELQWHDCDYEFVDQRPLAVQSVHPDPDALDLAAGILASARRPVVLAGRGAAGAESRAALLRLADRIGAPVATTLRAKDLFRDEGGDLGVFGTMSTPFALDAIAASDCVIVFGAGLNSWTTLDGSLLAGKRVIHCDIDRARIGKRYPVDAGIVGDAAAVADALIELLDHAEIQRTGFGASLPSSRVPEVPETSEPRPADDLSPLTSVVDVRTALTYVEHAVPRDRVVVTDAGRFAHSAFSIMHVPDPSSFVMSLAFGSIGLGLGMAIGASFGAVRRPVVLVTGDGGFMLGGLAEFNTAVRHGVDLIVVVCNDGSYGAEHIQFRDRGLDPGTSVFEWPEFAAVADSLGGQGVTVRSQADLADLSRVVEQRDRPLLIDLKLDPDQVPRVVFP